MTQPAPTLTIEVEGQRFLCAPETWNTLDCIETGPDEYHLLDAGRSHRITVMEFDLASRTCLLKVDGEIKRVRLLRDLDLLIERMGLNSIENKKLKHLEAPMPGMVTGVKVEPGQTVDKGTPLLILEAMKMENVITAPQPSIVKKILVTKGQAVDKGAILVEFE